MPRSLPLLWSLLIVAVLSVPLSLLAGGAWPEPQRRRPPQPRVAPLAAPAAAKQSQAKQSQAKQSQAKQSQAKQSQAKPPVRSPAQPLLPARYRGCTINRRLVPLRQKVIALTFDDGPNPAITPLVLDALERYQAQATFFVLGQWAEEWPGLIRREVAAGHAVESHTYSHPWEEINVPHAKRELQRTEVILDQLTGAPPQLFRPPFGQIDGNLARVAGRLNYCVTKWTICGSDKPNENVSDLVGRVTRQPVSGDIVLLHDGRSHIATAKALPEVLRRLRAAGFTFVTVPRLLRMWDAASPRQPKVAPPKKPLPPKKSPRHRHRRHRAHHARRACDWQAPGGLA